MRTSGEVVRWRKPNQVASVAPPVELDHGGIVSPYHMEWIKAKKSNLPRMQTNSGAVAVFTTLLAHMPNCCIRNETVSSAFTRRDLTIGGSSIATYHIATVKEMLLQRVSAVRSDVTGEFSAWGRDFWARLGSANILLVQLRTTFLTKSLHENNLEQSHSRCALRGLSFCLYPVL